MPAIRRIRFRRFVDVSCIAAALGVAAVAVPLVAAAQDTARGAAEPARESLLEEVVVSARKRSMNIVEVPLAVTALSAESLQQRGIIGFNELNDFVPGLRYENSAANRNDRGFHTIAMHSIVDPRNPMCQSLPAARS